MQKYSELFDTSADDLLDRAVVSRYHQIVHSAPDDDPVGLSLVLSAVQQTSIIRAFLTATMTRFMT